MSVTLNTRLVRRVCSQCRAKPVLPGRATCGDDCKAGPHRVKAEFDAYVPKILGFPFRAVKKGTCPLCGKSITRGQSKIVQIAPCWPWPAMRHDGVGDWFDHKDRPMRFVDRLEYAHHKCAEQRQRQYQKAKKQRRAKRRAKA
jgi:hypothetical protein